MKNSKKVITNKSEKQLAELAQFNGKYVSSLIKAAQSWMDVEGEDVKTLLASFKKRNKIRAIKEAKRFGLNPTSYKTLSNKAKDILSGFDTGHSMGCNKVLYVRLRNETIRFAENNDTSTYSNSCTWRAAHGQVCVILKKSELQKIQNIEGVWTIVNADGTAKWLAEKGSKNRHEIIWVNGFCVGNTHSTVSIEECEKGEAIKLQEVINAIKDDSRFVGYRHIKLTGACEAGINAYCKRNNLNKDFGYNLGFLKSMEYSSHFEKIQNEI